MEKERRKKNEVQVKEKEEGRKEKGRGGWKEKPLRYIDRF